MAVRNRETRIAKFGFLGFSLILSLCTCAFLISSVQSTRTEDEVQKHFLEKFNKSIADANALKDNHGPEDKFVIDRLSEVYEVTQVKRMIKGSDEEYADVDVWNIILYHGSCGMQECYINAKLSAENGDEVEEIRLDILRTGLWYGHSQEVIWKK